MKGEVPPTLEEVAYHEAGHAVAGVFFGGVHRPIFASINEKEQVLGFVASAGRPRTRRSAKLAVRDGIHALAGPAAVDRFTGRSPSHSWLFSVADDDDFNDAEIAVKLYHLIRGREVGDGESVCEGVDAFMIAARRLVDSYWDAVERVAAALLKKRNLRGRQITEIADITPRLKQMRKRR